MHAFVGRRLDSGRERSRSLMSAPDDSSLLQTHLTSNPPPIPVSLFSHGSTRVSTPGHDDEEQGQQVPNNGEAGERHNGEAADAVGNARRVTLEHQPETPGYNAFQVRTGPARRRACQPQFLASGTSGGGEPTGHQLPGPSPPPFAGYPASSDQIGHSTISPAL